jgi:hypothetical protein
LVTLYKDGESEEIEIPFIGDARQEPITASGRKEWDDFGFDKMAKEKTDLLKYIIGLGEEYVKEIHAIQSHIPIDSASDPSFDHMLEVQFDVDKLKEFNLVAAKCTQFTLSTVTNKEGDRFQSYTIYSGEYDLETKTALNAKAWSYGDVDFAVTKALNSYKWCRKFYWGEDN